MFILTVTLHVQACFFFFFFFTFVCVSGVLMCVQIQSDAQSTKGVKINVLFTFTFLSSNNGIHWLFSFWGKLSAESPVTLFFNMTPNSIKPVQIVNTLFVEPMELKHAGHYLKGRGSAWSKISFELWYLVV